MTHTVFSREIGCFILIVAIDIRHWSVGLEFWESKKRDCSALISLVILPLLLGVYKSKAEKEA